MQISSDHPLVSVIILCYNQGDIISRAIESVANQTYRNVQLVIVDDCSKDNSRQVITEWKNKYPGKIKTFFQQSNVGHPANMNTGYKLCDGELITFCDGDDWYFPEKVEREVEFLKTHPNVDVVHSNYDYYTIDGKFIKHWTTAEKLIPKGDIFLSLFSLAYPYKAHLRYELTSKKIIEETGYYDENIPIWVDWDFRLRLASKYKFGFCNYIGSAYTSNPDGLTNVLKQEIILKNLQIVIEKNKSVLEKYPRQTSMKVLKAIHLPVEKISLTVDFRKGKPSFFNTLKFLWQYPSEMKDTRFIINSMFGSRIMKFLSGVKHKISSAV